VQKDKVYASVQRHLQKGLIDKAIAELQQLLEQEPNDVRTRLRVGDLQARQGDTAGAIGSYLRVASDYAEQGFFLKSIAVYKQVLKLDPNQHAIFTTLAELYMRLGQTQDALSQYRQQLALLERNQQQVEVEATLLRILEIDPAYVPARIRLAESYVKAGRVPKAKEAFAAAAQQLLEQKQEDQWVQVLERLSFLDPADLPTNLSLARIYAERHDPHRALERLQPCFRQDPRNEAVLLPMVEAFLSLNQREKAAKVLHQLVDVYTAAGEPKVDLRQSTERRLAELMQAIRQGAGAEPAPMAAAAPPPAEHVGSVALQLGSMEMATFGPEATLDGPAKQANVERLIAEAESFTRLHLPLKAAEALHEAVGILWQRLDAAHRSGQSDLALIDLDKLLELEPQHLAAQALRAELLAAGPATEAPGPTAAAVAKPTQPAEPALADELQEVDFFLHQGLATEAQAVLEPLLAAYPTHAELRARQQRVDAQVATRRAAAPASLGAEAPTVAPANPASSTAEAPAAGDASDGETRYNLGLTYKVMGLFDEALQEFAAARHDPRWAHDAQRSVGICQLLRGQVSLARQVFSDLCAAPQLETAKQVQLHYEIGCAYQSLGQHADAGAFLASAVALDPTYQDAAQRLEKARAAASHSAQTVSGELDLVLLARQAPASTSRTSV
jgi:tetratricopeptide (TPR) repeat protein